MSPHGKSPCCRTFDDCADSSLAGPGNRNSGIWTQQMQTPFSPTGSQPFSPMNNGSANFGFNQSPNTPGGYQNQTMHGYGGNYQGYQQQ